MIIIKKSEIDELLSDEPSVIEEIRKSYEHHYQEASNLPHSVFLRFPEQPRNRIIGLPSYLGGDYNIAGFKWIASFPENIENGTPRASASIILNDMENGYPIAFMEGATISAKRTAASAALAGKLLHWNDNETRIGLIGNGVINHEILKFTLSQFKNIQEIHLFDMSFDNALRFEKILEKEFSQETIVHETVDTLIEDCDLISFATTAPSPFVDNKKLIQKEKTVLHISLRDIAVDLIKNAHNIVDDVDHVSRERTSIHLTEQETGNRNHVDGTLEEIFENKIDLKNQREKAVIFSPFGLGVLDLALANAVYKKAKNDDVGIFVENFSLAEA